MFPCLLICKNFDLNYFFGGGGWYAVRDPSGAFVFLHLIMRRGQTSCYFVLLPRLSLASVCVYERRTLWLKHGCKQKMRLIKASELNNYAMCVPVFVRLRTLKCVRKHGSFVKPASDFSTLTLTLTQVH